MTREKWGGGTKLMSGMGIGVNKRGVEKKQERKSRGL